MDKRFKGPVWECERDKFIEACQKAKSLEDIIKFIGLIKKRRNQYRRSVSKRIEYENIDISHIPNGKNWRNKNKAPRLIDTLSKNEKGLFVCPHCAKPYNKRGIGNHIWRNHGEGKNFRYLGNGGIPSWNKGKTKESDSRIKKGIKTLQKRIQKGTIVPHQLGKPLSEEHKKTISEKMKKAHAEGRAWNIGQSRWNNEPSYPEKFFMKVIKNEFKDKKYKREHPFDKYSLDFAWLQKKRCIEIDGEQHQRFEDYKARDQKKDQLLKESGWEVLRIAWKDMFNEPQKWIQIAKDFIHKP